MKEFLKNERTGFTFIELLCVIIILSFLISVSVPTLAKTARSFYFRNQAKKFEALLKYLKKISVLEERAYKLTLDFPKNSYEILRLDKSDQPYKFKKMSDSILHGRTLSSKIFLKSDTADLNKKEIIFQPDGNITHSEFYIQNLKNQRAKLTTTLSGEIYLEFPK